MRSTKQNGAVLTSEEFKACHEANNFVACERLSHYPLASWHELGDPLGGTADASVYKSAARVVQASNQSPIYKQSPHTFFVVKLKEVPLEQHSVLKSIFDAHTKAMRVPYAKIKPPRVYTQEEVYVISVVMAELKGKTLADILFEDGSSYQQQRKLTISVIETLQIMREIAWSLLCDIHVNGLVHRDISPANVMVNCAVSPPVARIYDFDFCKLAGERNVREGVGTPLFMSPEALMGKFTSEATDVFGLGWLFYLLLRGEMPKLTSLAEVRQFASHFQYKRLFEGMDAGLPSEEQVTLRELLVGMLHPEQSRRPSVRHCFETVEEVLLKLELRSASEASVIAASRTYLLAVSLRKVLIEVASTVTVSERLSFNINESVAQTINLLMAGPFDLSLFLSVLRVEALKDVVSLTDLRSKVCTIIDNFSMSYSKAKQLQGESGRLCSALLEAPHIGRSAEALRGVRQSMDYLLAHYEPYAWSLDNLVMLERKLQKLLARAMPVFESARRELAAIQAEKLNLSVAEWMSYWSSAKRAQDAVRGVGRISDERDPLTGKRKLY